MMDYLMCSQMLQVAEHHAGPWVRGTSATTMLVIVHATARAPILAERKCRVSQAGKPIVQVRLISCRAYISIA